MICVECVPQSFREDDDDEGVSAADIGSAGSGLESLEEFENESCTSDLTEASDSAKDDDNSSSGYDMQEMVAALQPIIRKRIKNWEKNSIFEFTEERITKEGCTRIKGTRRNSMRYNEEEIVYTPNRAGRLDVSVATPASVRRSKRAHLDDAGVQVVRRTTTTTIVEEVVTVNKGRAQPRSTKKKRNFSEDSDDDDWSPKRPSPPKLRKKLSAIKDAEKVICEAQPSPSPLRSNILGKILRENGIHEEAPGDLVLRKGDELVFQPGSARKEIESAIQPTDDKEDILSRLSQLRRPTLVQRLVESENENTPNKSRSAPTGARVVSRRKSVYHCEPESNQKPAKPAPLNKSRRISLSETPHTTKRGLHYLE